ncbi:MAG: FkbM family methyltransferase [Porphyromonadaceae bacterium]|nr:FkbM family methyltransferase [Porphyromonadaceae bacterium]
MPLQLVVKLAHLVSYYFRLYIICDPFLWSVKRWFSDQGDQTLRLNYPLNASSIVLDVGGYKGDYSDAVYQKFGCHIYLFEPVPNFYAECVKRFSGNLSIVCLNYGLSSKSGWFEMHLNNNESSFNKIGTYGLTQRAEVRSISDAITELGIDKIDLVKINIEGGEFELLPEIIESGLITRIKYIQVQFHNIDSDAVDACLRIRSSLSKTHRQMWNYEFVWESWERL